MVPHANLHGRRIAKAKVDADIEGLDALLDPLDDSRDKLGNNAPASSADWSGEGVAELVAKDLDLLLDSSADKKFLDVGDDALAHLAENAIPNLDNVVWLPGLDNALAETKLDADIEADKTLLEPLHDEWDALGDRSLADGADWSWKSSAKLVDEHLDLLLDRAADHELSNIVDSSLAHGAGKIVPPGVWAAGHLGAAETDLGADVNGLKTLLEPLHDLRDVGAGDDVADSADWDWEERAGSLDKGNNLRLDKGGVESSLDNADDLLAAVAHAVGRLWHPDVGEGDLLGSLGSIAKAKLDADVENLDLLLEPAHDDWDELRNGGNADGADWGWELLAGNLDKSDDFLLGLLVDKELLDVLDHGLAHVAGDAGVLLADPDGHPGWELPLDSLLVEAWG